jgi:hypothetical protein
MGNGFGASDERAGMGEFLARGAVGLLLVTGIQFAVLPPVWAKKPKPEPSAGTHATVQFAERDKIAIRDYYRHPGSGASGLPPGLANKQQLPPGLQKQVREKGTLPPGLQKRLLPGELEGRLSRLPPGYERVIVGADVVIVEIATRIIVDILADILK